MEKKTYINILTDTLRKKINLLDQLISLTKEQEEIVSSNDSDRDRLEGTITEKEALINGLNQLDTGFEKVYQHVQAELQGNKNQYKDQILILQELILSITEKSSTLQAMELRNKGKFQLFFAGGKKEIKNFKLSSQTASKYYKSVINLPQDEAHFLDKKK